MKGFSPDPARGEAWLAAFDAAHPEIARAPGRPGYQRGFDAYKAEARPTIAWLALEMFRTRHGRYPDPVALPETCDHFFASKFYDFVPMPTPADKLGLANYLPAAMADRVYAPDRPWVAAFPGLPPDEAVPPGRYLVKLAFGSGQNMPVNWPPTADERVEIEKTIHTRFKQRFGTQWGEWWYALGKQRVFLEEDLSDRMAERSEVKIYVREGRPVLGYQIVHDFETHVHSQSYFDSALGPLEGLTEGFRPLRSRLPESIGSMMAVAAAVGTRFSLVRVDFLDVGGSRPCLGELTLCDMNACRRYDSPEFERLARRLLFE